jgi:ElaB/YqjD/DUF883 family membrane-anchored ribosome-binding protein
MPRANDDPVESGLNIAADAAHDRVNKVADAVGEVAGKTSRVTSAVIGSAVGASDTAASAVNDAVDVTQENVSKGVRQVTETAVDMSGKTAEAVRKYPLRTFLVVAAAAGLVGFVAGIVRAKRG